jgi:hypothetical protein
MAGIFPADAGRGNAHAIQTEHHFEGAVYGLTVLWRNDIGFRARR